MPECRRTRLGRSGETSTGAAVALLHRGRDVESGGERAVPRSRPRERWPAVVAADERARRACRFWNAQAVRTARFGPLRWYSAATYAGCPANACGWICARDGNACAMVQRGGSADRRGTANRVAVVTNGELRN
jgi:hypothetical protein